MSKTVVIIQSNYLPWQGYFHLLASADEVLLLDCVQYTRGDWRNRNLIKTPNGTAWLTVPVLVRGRFNQAIDEARVGDGTWADKHLRSILMNYKRAAGFAEASPWLGEELRAAAKEELLTRINERLIRAVCMRLGIGVPIRRCTDVIERNALRDMNATRRLIELCRAAGASRYLSGPAARAYLDTGQMADAGIEVAWMDYGDYPPYPQLWGEFTSRVSIIDLLLNTGDAAAEVFRQSGAMSDAALA